MTEIVIYSTDKDHLAADPNWLPAVGPARDVEADMSSNYGPLPYGHQVITSADGQQIIAPNTDSRVK
jgi:hypothetical protein